MLKDKTDQESKKRKEEAEALLDSFKDIMDLYTSIINSSNTLTQTEIDQTDNKNVFSRMGDWIGEQRSKAGNWIGEQRSKARTWVGEQRNSVWDTEKLKTERRRNGLRTAGFVATGVGVLGLAYKGAKKLWNWAFGDDEGDNRAENNNSYESNEEDNSTENDNSSEDKQGGKKDKESRLERGFNILLSYLGKKSKE